jgi:hypothetical protein
MAVTPTLLVAAKPRQRAVVEKGMLLWRIIRRLLALAIRFAIVNRGLILCLALLTVLAFAVVSAWSPGSQSQTPTRGNGGSPSATATSATPVPGQAVGNYLPAPSQAVESYLTGMRGFDAKRMWSTFSAEYAKQLIDQGITEGSIQQRSDKERQAGVVWEFTYIGQYALADGGRYYFLVATGRDSGGTGAPHEVYFVFTVSADGAISAIG